MPGLPPTITDATVTLTWGAAGQYYGYCTIADVIVDLPSYSQYPDLSGNAGRSIMAEVLSTVAEVDMQLMIGTHYTLPYLGTDPGVQYFLRIINRKLAASGLLDRMTHGADEASPSAAALRSEAELLVADLVSGEIDFTDVLDFVPRARKPLFDRAQAATIVPSPTMDGTGATPIFVIGGRTRFRPDDNY